MRKKMDMLLDFCIIFLICVFIILVVFLAIYFISKPNNNNTIDYNIIKENIENMCKEDCEESNGIYINQIEKNFNSRCICLINNYPVNIW